MYSAGYPDSRPVSSSAIYSCDTGYTLTGGAFIFNFTRVCVTGRRWSGSPPTCQRELCNCYTVCVCDYICNPIVNQISGCEVNIEDIIPYTVNTGPTEPPTTCSDLIAPTNGMINYTMRTASPRSVGTVATYTCITDYTVTGGDTRTCRSDGVWSGTTPTCQRKWN